MRYFLIGMVGAFVVASLLAIMVTAMVRPASQGAPPLPVGTVIMILGTPEDPCERLSKDWKPKDWPETLPLSSPGASPEFKSWYFLCEKVR